MHSSSCQCITNDNSRLIQKTILKTEAQLSVLQSYVDCELSALTSKIDMFSDSIKNVLSDLQNKEHEKSQIEVLKKNITFLQNEIKSKDTYRIITRNTEDSYEVLMRPNPQTLPVDRQSQPKKLRQHQDHYQHHRQYQQQYSQSQAQQQLQQFQESKTAAQKTQQSLPFRRNNPPHKNKFDTVYIGIQYTDDTTVSDLYELFGPHSAQCLSENSDIQMSRLENTGKRRGFAYITVPEHAHKEIVKLHSIEFNGRKLIIEKAKTPPKKTTGKNKQAFPQTQSPAMDFEMETLEPFSPI